VRDLNRFDSSAVGQRQKRKDKREDEMKRNFLLIYFKVINKNI
jgi:hypothetical protein